MAVTAPARLDPRALLAEGAHLIGGDWVPAGNGETLDVINPATQEVLLAVPSGRAGDINDAVQAAAAAFPAWRDASPVARAEARYRWAAIFGPVLSVLSYDDDDEAVAIANGTRYGLNASIWTSDVSRAVRLATSVQAGQVTINGFGSFGVIGAPWGGYKHSGFGRTMSADSVLDYTQLKSIIINAVG